MTTKEEAIAKFRESLFMGLGMASMCWSETPKGVFESTRALEIGNSIMNDLEDLLCLLKKISREEVAS